MLADALLGEAAFRQGADEFSMSADHLVSCTGHGEGEVRRGATLDIADGWGDAIEEEEPCLMVKLGFDHDVQHPHSKIVNEYYKHIGGPN